MVDSTAGPLLHAISLILTPTEGVRELTANMECGSKPPRIALDGHVPASSSEPGTICAFLLPLSMATVVWEGSRLTERLWVGIWSVSSKPILRLPDVLIWVTTWPWLHVRIVSVTIWTCTWKSWTKHLLALYYYQDWMYSSLNSLCPNNSETKWENKSLVIGSAYIYCRRSWLSSNQTVVSTGAAESSCKFQEALSNWTVLPCLWSGGLHVGISTYICLCLPLLLHISGESTIPVFPSKTYQQLCILQSFPDTVRYCSLLII